MAIICNRKYSVYLIQRHLTKILVDSNINKITIEIAMFTNESKLQLMCPTLLKEKDKYVPYTDTFINIFKYMQF